MGINKSYGKKITLGSSWIIGHDVIFDKQNGLIGFAEANCNQNELINKTNGLELKDDISEDAVINVFCMCYYSFCWQK